MSKLVICPDCGGDGKETCHNPDHGFINTLSFTEIGRLGCPVCGHDEKHKVPNGTDCETCGGTGEVTVEQAINYIDEMDIDYWDDDWNE